MTSIDDQIKAGMRQLIVTQGSRVKLQEPWWDGDTSEHVSTYGWHDGEAGDHIHPGSYSKKRGNKGCEWIVPEGSVVKEVQYSQFMGTFTGNKEEVGINAYGCRCKCGKYSDVVLRYTGTLGDAIQAILGFDPTKQMTL